MGVANTSSVGKGSKFASNSSCLPLQPASVVTLLGFGCRVVAVLLIQFLGYQLGNARNQWHWYPHVAAVAREYAPKCVE
jgi:hypothetical protein